MMTFMQAVGVGVGIGAVHGLCLFLILVLARSNAKRREDETLDLMRQRNELDQQKVDWLDSICQSLRSKQ